MLTEFDSVSIDDVEQALMALEAWRNAERAAVKR